MSRERWARRCANCGGAPANFTTPGSNALLDLDIMAEASRLESIEAAGEPLTVEEESLIGEVATDAITIGCAYDGFPHRVRAADLILMLDRRGFVITRKAQP